MSFSPNGAGPLKQQSQIHRLQPNNKELHTIECSIIPLPPYGQF